MKTIHILLIKELKLLFLTPRFYLIGAAFLFISGLLFMGLLSNVQEQMGTQVIALVMGNFVGQMNVVLLLVVPFLTMQAFGSERQDKTDILLYLSGRSFLAIVLAKLSAYFIAISLFLILSLVCPLSLKFSGYSDVKFIAVSYLGVWLESLGFISIGIFFSCFFNTQVLAAISTWLALILMIFISNAQFLLESYELGKMLASFGIIYHLRPFLSGVVGVNSLVYYISLPLIFIYLSQAMINLRRF